MQEVAASRISGSSEATPKCGYNGAICMAKPNQRLRDLAGHLLEAGRASGEIQVHPAVTVTETLRVPLTRLAGSEGFASLLRRAIVLAAAEVPALHVVFIGGDGRLYGLDADDGTDEAANEAAAAITVQLLGLLATFIGEGLMLHVVREAWPAEKISTIEDNDEH